MHGPAKIQKVTQFLKIQNNKSLNMFRYAQSTPRRTKKNVTKIIFILNLL